MFFTNDVLVPNGGKFSIIWLAATRKNKVKRRDCDGVDITKICKELRKNIKPVSDRRMTSIKGFSLRLSAQLVYGVTVVYNMKVIHLYKDASLSVQSLHRFQSQLQLYPIKIVTAPATTSIPSDLPETFRQEDPMFGQPPEDIGFGSGYLTQVSSSDVPSDESYQIATRREKAQKYIYSVKDLSAITIPEEIPKTSFQFEDDQHLLEGDILTGPGIITDMIHDMRDIYSMMPDEEITQANEKAAANLMTPASALQTSVTTPPRPSKTRPVSPAKSKSSEDTLAVPLSSPSSADKHELGAKGGEEGPDIIPTAEPIIEIPARSADVSDAASHSTAELVLPPLPEKRLSQQFFSRAHPSLIVDKKIELHSDLIRNQLSLPLNRIEEYAAEGNLEISTDLFSSMKQLFEQPLTTLYQHLPSQVAPYVGRSAQARARRRISESVPQALFANSLSVLSQSASKKADSPGFAAHKVMTKQESELLRPEDEYAHLQNGPHFDETFASGLAADETFVTEGSSISGFRDVSRLSAMPHSLGERFSGLDQAGISGSLEQSQLQPEDLDSAMRQIDLNLDLLAPKTSAVTFTNLLPSCSATKEKIEELELLSDSGVLFSSLAPPGVITRAQAAQSFFNILSEFPMC